MGFHASSWALSEHPLRLGMGADHFMYREEESFLFKELKRLLCLKYVFLFQVVFFNFGSLLYTPFPSYRYNDEQGWTYFRLLIYSKYRKMMHAEHTRLHAYHIFTIDFRACVRVFVCDVTLPPGRLRWTLTYL